jgi:hypothetical protein
MFATAHQPDRAAVYGTGRADIQSTCVENKSLGSTVEAKRICIEKNSPSAITSSTSAVLKRKGLGLVWALL